MKTVNQTTVTTQTDFSTAMTNIDGERLVIEQTKEGLTIGKMSEGRVEPLVAIWKDAVLRVDVNRDYLHTTPEDMRAPSGLHDEIPEIAFVPVSSDEEIKFDLEELLGLKV